MTDRQPDNDDTQPTGDDEMHRTTVAYIIGFIVLMFGFGWGSIPLYRMVCAKLDPGGSSYFNGEADEYQNVEVDESRTLDVRFTTNVQDDLPWEFAHGKPSVEVHPGEKSLVQFEATNLDPNRAITGKAVYDINPPEAGQYFKKIECFCFKQQTLEGGQTREMPLYFWMDPDIPEHIDKVTLAYTFFNAESSRQRDDERAAR